VNPRSEVARSWARALFALARERNQVDAITRELETLVAEVEGNEELRGFLSRPWVPAAARRSVAADVARRLGVSKLGQDFLTLVAGQGRADHLGVIARAFRDLVDDDRGVVRARVRTAIALTGAERAGLARRLQAALARLPDSGRRAAPEVLVEDVVDRNLLGGFVAEIGSLIVDGSLEGQLARMRERLAREPAMERGTA
jgi:F-type H+-transporting ATPase subunit delta